MKLFSPIKISYKNLMASKMRSFLTMLGIIIGIASVIIVMAIGASAQQLVLSQVSGIGSNLVGILPGASSEDGPPAQVLGIVTTTLKNSDLLALLQKKNVPGAVSGSGYVSGVAVARRGNVSQSASYQGVSASFPSVEDIEVQYGRFFTQEEDASLARVAVLGYGKAAEFFGEDDPLGKTILLKGMNLTVVGILEQRGAVAFSNPDDLIYVPLQTAQKLFLGIDYLNFARIKVDSAENVDRAVADIKTTLRIAHGIKNPQDDDFSVRDTAQALTTLTNITDILKYFLAGIAAISLVVGGVGIMNIMLISVNQRIREVGLRKAVGARRRHIITQFLIESVFITFVGGLIGIIFGTGVSFLAAVVIGALGYEWQFIIPPSSVLLATSVAVLIGVIFGLYPARKASGISPIEALRYE
ncbi:MAG TPA: ABC transporter permease [Candidatus Moranbacteria bacterium]|nr:ABC transporter permease [Candidatus Moranbacteria bacterium]